RDGMASLVHPISFMVAQRHLLDLFNYLLTRTETRDLDLGGLANLRDAVRRGVEEYYNIDFTMTYPHRSIVEKGKHVMGLDDMHRVINEKIEHRNEIMTTEYERRYGSYQLVLTVLFGVLGIFGAIGVVWAAGPSLGWDAGQMLAGTVLSAIAMVLALGAAAIYFHYFRGRIAFI